MRDFQRLTDPWIPTQWAEEVFSTYGSTSAPSGLATGNYLGANVAVIAPIVFPCSATIYSLSIAGGNATGNFDLGLYKADFSKIKSLGSTALSAAVKTLTLDADYRVHAGDLLYAAFVASSTSSNIVQFIGPGTGTQILAEQSSALPLPDPIVPVALTNSRRFPLFSFGIR